MALTKVKGSGVEGITNLSNATFLSVDASEVATLLTSAVINSEGGAVTTNIAQGLAKCWAQIEGDITGYFDSFNTSSLTDVSAGRPRVTYTSNMANDDASLTISHQYTASSGTGSYFANVGTRATTHHDHNHYQNGSLIDAEKYNGTVHGDLA